MSSSVKKPVVSPRGVSAAALVAAFGAALSLAPSPVFAEGHLASRQGPAWDAREAQLRSVYRAPAGFSRWRPLSAVPATRAGGLPPAKRLWTRKARPLGSRGRDVWAQFRPDHRFDPNAQAREPARPAAEQADLHAQFRPLRPRVNRTYEQLQQSQAAHTVPQAPAQPMPYPMAPYMMPSPAMGYWPYW